MLKHPSPSLETKNLPTSSAKTSRKSPQISSPIPKQSPTPKPDNQTSTESPAPPFRSVSACNRCRLRKHRCDQRLPRCESCEKAQVRCVGYDPLTKQEVPRSYVAFLESRVNYLHQVLVDHGIRFKPAIAYDEEEALKMEAGQSPRFESRGLRDARESPTQSQSQDMGIGARASRKRKLQYSEDAIPSRQVKRLAQLNLLLTELLTDGRVREDLLEQRLPLSPRSLDSVDSERRAVRSESPVSLNEPYTTGRGSSLLGVKTMGSESGCEGLDAKRRSGVGVDLGDFESEIHTKTVGKVGNGGRRLNGSSRASSPEKEGSSPEAKFDIAADLLRGRRERERGNYDLLDEFLVDWAE
ncbi:unnamed protein product [Penicillium glandicola]